MKKGTIPANTVLIILGAILITGTTAFLIAEQQAKIDGLQAKVDHASSRLQMTEAELYTGTSPAAADAAADNSRALQSRISQLEDKLADQELLLLRRTNKQASEIDEIEKSTKKLRKELSGVKGESQDFSTTIDDAIKGTAAIGISIQTTPAEFSFDWEMQAARKTLKAEKYVKLADENLTETRFTIGSGSIVTRQGNVLTNRHVTEALDEITQNREDFCEFLRFSFRRQCAGPLTSEVRSHDGQTSPVLFTSESSNYDLALIGTALIPEKVLKIGNSDDLKAGQEVIAIGNPQLLDFTATQGIVSAVNRKLDEITLGTSDALYIGDYWIQTDTPVNPGSSGGPLLDKNGRIVGIITLGLGTSLGGDAGLNMAIPSNIARQEFGLFNN